MQGALVVATPTLDLTRFPGVVWPTEPPPTPQILVPGGSSPIFVPQPAPGAPAVQTVVVIIVTATPEPLPTPTPGPPTGTPPPTPTPGPPTATPTATGTPLPPVQVQVKTTNANVRQGPGRRLSAGRQDRPGHRDHRRGPQPERDMVEGLLRQRRRCVDLRPGRHRDGTGLDGVGGHGHSAAATDR